MRPASPARPGSPTVVIGCGALARELLALLRPVPGIDLVCLPATLHSRPERIAGAAREAIRRAHETHGPGVRILVGYADCGTGGQLDAVLAETGAERLPGAHCYEVYAGSAAFAALSEEEPGTFYLTDFLARQFDALVWRPLKLDRHPQLLPQLFGNYRRLVYLAQTDDPALDAAAQQAAERLGLAYERRFTGLVGLEADLSAGLAAVGAVQAAGADETAAPRPGAPA